VDQGAVGTELTRADAPSEPPARPRRRARLAVDLTALSIVGVLLLAALGATGAVLYREFYSATAFVERYIGMLADGHAADALALPGVSVDSADLQAAGMPAGASDALLRRAALATLTDVREVSEESDGAITRVTVAYTAGGHTGRSTFAVTQTGWIGVAPAWRFATSPLALVDLTVRGAMSFEVNGFEIDKRQVSIDGADADPLAALPLLVFSPGAYSITVDTPISTSPGVAVLSDAPMMTVPVDIQADPTSEFVDVVQQRVDEFLSSCATQDVLQPSACPFGYPVQDRIVSAPTWSIVQQPVVTVEADGAHWRIPAAEAVAHIEVDIRSLYDGTVRSVSEDVPFVVTGRIEVLPDGTASITVGGIDAQ
jgi:hypothetical protein